MVVAAWLIPPLRGGAAAGWRQRLILGWSGMRGAVSLAAVLAVPTVDNRGAPLAGRDDLIYMAFAVIFVTLIGQGLSLPFLVRALGLTENPSIAETERQARLELARSALRRIDESSDRGDVADETADALRAQHQARIRHLDGWPEGGDGDAGRGRRRRSGCRSDAAHGCDRRPAGRAA
jgi:NhaP-type Na+/H+ or K+/H+ antiporter